MKDLSSPSEFLAQVSSLMGWPLSLEEMGAARILKGHLTNHVVEIGCSAGFWLETTIVWSEFPADVSVAHAPVGSYDRVKFTESGYSPPLTGDLPFDEIYILLGYPAPTEFALSLPAWLRSALLAHCVLRPTLHAGTSIELVNGKAAISKLPDGHVRIRCRPDDRENATGSIFVKMGTQRFTPEYCVKMAGELEQLLNALSKEAA